MKGIVKRDQEPEELSAYKERFAAAPRLPKWKSFRKDDQRYRAVKTALRNDQRGLCAYCENALVPCDESVEHIVARHHDHDRELDWTNLLLCCAGGERPVPDEIADGAFRFSPSDRKTCGHAKLGSTQTILCPLHIPHAPRLYRILSEDGRIVVDEPACQDAGIDPQVAADTIGALNLHAGRLNKARLAILNALVQELGEAGATAPFSVERERDLAAGYFPVTGTLPAFFTTLRFALGEGAELHLSKTGFRG